MSNPLLKPEPASDLPNSDGAEVDSARRATDPAPPTSQLGVSPTDPASEDAAAGALVGTVLADRYRVQKLLGAGGMGSVYLAEHVHMRKAFAIKVLHREMTYLPEIVARFEREAVAAARIDHPHVAAATDFGRLDDGSFYLVLEFVQGQPLSALLKQEKRLPPERALGIGRQVAEALAAAHELGIVHRDLKPDNVMLIDKDGDPDYVKVLDFGIAKVAADENKDDGSHQKLTQMGSIFGTPEYMAPEQAQGAEVDARADLYTLGVVIYEMLAGTSPFRDPDVLVVLTRQLTVEPPALPSDVPRPVAALVTRLLQKTREKRVASARDLIDAIDALGIVPVAPLSAAARSLRRDEVGDTVLSMQRPTLGGAGASSVLSGTLTAVRSLVGRTLSAVARTGPFFAREVRIRSRTVPIWAIGGALFGLIAAAGIGAFALSPQPGQPSGGGGIVAKLAEAQNALDPNLDELIERAATGEKKALAELEGRAEWRRSAKEWRALGIGYFGNQDYPAALKAFGTAIQKEAALSHDDEIIDRARRMVQKPGVEDDALQFLATSLGRTGADMLYDIWNSSKSLSNEAELAQKARAQLDSASVRARASPALLVALDLGVAKGCLGYKKIMPQAAEHADARSLPTLKRLTQRRGCGFLGLSDCYSCLRSDDSLSRAIALAQERDAPEFGGQSAGKDKDKNVVTRVKKARDSE